MKTLFEGKKLYAVIIAFLLMIAFFITLHIIRNHYQHVFKNVITENTSTANLLSTLMYEHQKAAISILESYSQRPLFIDAVKKKDFHRAVYHLKSLSEHHTEMDALFITDQSGTLWANYPVDRTGFGKSLAYRDWYKGVSKKWRPYISTIFRLIVLEKGLAVSVSVPVFDRNGKVIGILGGAQRTPFFAAFIKGNIIDPRKSIALLDQEGNIIFSNAVPYYEKITKYPDAHVLEKALAGVIIDMEIADAKEKGSISYVSIAPVKGLGWSVIVGQEKNAILKSLYRYSILSAVVGFVIFLFLTVSLLYFRREYKYRKTKELLQAVEKYRDIFENTVEGIYRTTPEGRFIIINPAFAAICGYASPEEMIEKVTDIPNQLYANPEDRLRLQKRIAAEEKVKGFEVQFKTPTRGLVWVSIHAKALRDEQGNIRHYDGTIEDITGRKRAEEALRESEENFRRSLDESPMGVRIVTIEGETIYANRVMLDIYGYDSIEEFNTIPIKKRYTPESYAEFQIRKEKRKQSDYTPSEYEVSIVRKDGEVRRLQVFRKTILWDGEKQFQTIYQDISDRKRAEEALGASREQMRALAGRLQKVREEERTQIAREIHDELGGALTGLKIDFSLLTRAALKIENKTVRTSLLAGMDSMIKFIDATIHTVRRIAMELRPGVLDDLGLIAALEWQLKDFEKRTGIRSELFPPVEEITLDADLSTALFRIFQEALTNVARHSGATEVRVRLRADADSATLEVEDNGKGIEKEKIHSSKSLGLLGMRERAQMFGGRIIVMGTPGMGTKVTVEIPSVEKRKMDRDQGGDAG